MHIMMTFNQIRSQAPYKQFRGTVLSFDPGETTGMACFVAGEEVQLAASKQLKTWPLQDAIPTLSHVLTNYKPTIVVFELYRVYNWKTDQHANSEVPTLQVIGCLKTLCILQGLPFIAQQAQIAKQFVTDEKLERWGY